MRLFARSAVVVLALAVLTGCGGSSPSVRRSCTDLCHAMTSFAAELRVSSPVGSASECQADCRVATEASKQAADDRVVALAEATPEDRTEMMSEMQLDPPLFD